MVPKWNSPDDEPSRLKAARLIWIAVFFFVLLFLVKSMKTHRFFSGSRFIHTHDGTRP